MGGFCAIYYGLKYNYEIISCAADFYFDLPEYCEYASGGTSPEDFNWYNGLILDVIKNAGQSGYNKNMFLCWGKGEGTWVLKNQGPAMLRALDDAGISYTLRLYDYSTHASIHNVFPEILKQRLSIFLGLIDEETNSDEVTPAQIAYDAANEFINNRETADGFEAVRGEHNVSIETLPHLVDFDEYCSDLSKLKNDIIIAVVSRGSFTPESDPALSTLSETLGLCNLSGKRQVVYAAVIDGGKVKKERFDNCSVSLKYITENQEIRLFSEQTVNSKSGLIYVNNSQTAMNVIGLNFVIIDKANDKVADSVVFSISGAEKRCFRSKCINLFFDDLKDIEMNCDIKMLENSGNTVSANTIREFVYAKQNYYWFPGKNTPVLSDDGFWRTALLTNKEYSVSFEFQATTLNYYRQTRNKEALDLLIENITEYFSLKKLIVSLCSTEYHKNYNAAVSRGKFFVNLFCECRKSNTYLPETLRKNIQMEIISTAAQIASKPIYITSMTTIYTRLHFLLNICALFKNHDLFFKTTYNKVINAAKIITEYYFDKNGVCTFEQVRIQQIVMPYIEKLVDFVISNNLLQTNDFKRLKRLYLNIKNAASHLIGQNGIIPNLGKSDFTKFDTPHLSGNFIKPDSNIAVLSDESAYITINGGSNIHSTVRHCDLLSFTFRYKGEMIVYDAGGGDGNIEDYASSAVAHSALICDEQNYLTPDYSDWTAIDDTVEKEDYVIVSAKHLMYKDVVLSREYIWVKPNIIILYDKAQSSSEHLYTQNFLFPNVPFDDNDINNVRFDINESFSFNVRQFPIGEKIPEMKNYFGTNNPDSSIGEMRGSLCRQYKKLEPLINSAYEIKDASAEFLTAIEVHTNDRSELYLESVNIAGNSVNISVKNSDGKLVEICEKLEISFNLW